MNPLFSCILVALYVASSSVSAFLEQKKEDGYSNTFGWESLQGETGISDTDLHPSGWVRVKDQRIFVVSEGEFIEEGKEIKILSVDGNRVLVRELTK